MWSAGRLLRKMRPNIDTFLKTMIRLPPVLKPGHLANETIDIIFGAQKAVHFDHPKNTRNGLFMIIQKPELVTYCYGIILGKLPI